MLKNDQYVRALAMESATKLVTSEEYMKKADGSRVVVGLADVFDLADRIADYIQLGNPSVD